MNIDKILIEQWKDRIPKNWYGFSGIPKQWEKPINDFLKEVEILCPDFEIHQIKEKFFRIRIHIELNCYNLEIINKIEEKIEILEDTLFDENLIYS